MAAGVFPSARRHSEPGGSYLRGNPPDERYSGTTSLAPRIYEEGGPRSGRGSLSAAAAGTLSVTASPCQLSRRESQGSCAPFLPPAFMRGEGHAVAGGVLRRSGGENLLSHGFAVPAPPEGKPRALRPDHRSFQASVHCCYVTLRILPWGEFSGPVRLRERHFFVQFVENDEKYFFIPHFPIAFCAI